MASILPPADTYVNYGRGYCSSSHHENNLSQILKIHPHLARITLENRLVKLVKETVLIFWEGSFGGLKVVFRPPVGW
jgi:hypothetical protein